MSLTLTLAAFFKQHPNQWIDGRVLARIAGSYAWRSRVSDCRTTLQMTIENRQERHMAVDCSMYTVSLYRYVPPAETLLDLLDATHANV